LTTSREPDHRSLATPGQGPSTTSKLHAYSHLTRECLTIVADTSLSSHRVVRELDAIVQQRGKPLKVVSDTELHLTRSYNGSKTPALSGIALRRASRSRTPSWKASTAGSATSA
jgi:hypothetical protein